MANTQTVKIARWLVGATGAAVIGMQDTALASEDQKFPYAGKCASLGADRTTEFHGNPQRAELLLGMAGNQWVVFDEVIRKFNLHRGLDGTIPANQAGYTLKDLRAKGRGEYYIQLIPPGQIRDQIKSGCMLLGNVDPNEPTRNFLPFSLQVELDVFTSTNYKLMQDLAASGFVKEAKPYIKNKLDLLVQEGNPHGIGDGVMPSGVEPKGAANVDKVVDLAFDLLDPDVPVSQVDHVNEGIHRAINSMYQRMDEYIRANGTPSQVAELDARLKAVAVPQPGSPAATRTGITTNFDLAKNPACNHGDGTLRFCEFAVLNKSNTHETRVHHVETPERVRSGESWTGPLWITEVSYARASGNPVAVAGVDIAAADPDEVVNSPVSYSIALLSTAKHKRLANAFIDWIRSPEGQRVYVDGGFIGLTDAELAGGECYAVDPKTGEFVTTKRMNDSC